MQIMRNSLAGCLVATLVVACSTMEVRPVKEPIAKACIEKNDDVHVEDFLQVLESGLQRHGVQTEVYSGQRPAHCQYRVTYAVWRQWDLVAYLSRAEIRLDKDGTSVASGTYHLTGGGGLDLGKYRGTKAKIDPVINEMMTGRKVVQ
jgi:hypothetical protein